MMEGARAPGGGASPPLLRCCWQVGGGAGGLSLVWKLAILLVLVLQLKLWGLSGGGGGGGTNGGTSAAGSFSAASEVQWLRQAVDERLQALQQRVDATVARAAVAIQEQQQHLQGAGGALQEPDPAGPGRAQLLDEEPQTDVSALLRRAATGSPEARRLQKLQYCDKYGRDEGLTPLKASDLLPRWKPAPGKYLFPLCTNGRLSNRLVCMQSYVIMAVLLNRTLIVPDAEPGPLGYQYRLVFDVPHARRCTGDDATNATLITLTEYQTRLAAQAAWREDPAQVKVAVQRVLNFKRYSAAAARRLWPPGASPVTVPDKAEPVRGKIHSLADLRAVVGAAREPLISLGDLFWMVPFPGTPVRLWAQEDAFWPAAFPDMPPAWTRLMLRPPLRSLRSCALFMQPATAIMEAAKGVAATVAGSGTAAGPDPFLALHWRRADFLQYWNDRDCGAGVAGAARQLCRAPALVAVARCVREKVRGTGIRVVYLATDARPAEVAALEKLLAPAGLVLVSRPSDMAVRWTWAERWIQGRLADSPLAVATLDKVVCALADVFMGTLHSTFSQEIVAMRAALGTLTCQDQDVCRVYPYSDKQLPFFNETDFFDRPFRRRLRRRSLL